MILGFDFLGFQAIKRFPTKNRIFLHVMQSTITKNSFLLVFYSYVLVFYPYVTGMYLVCTTDLYYWIKHPFEFSDPILKPEYL